MKKLSILAVVVSFFAIACSNNSNSATTAADSTAIADSINRLKDTTMHTDTAMHPMPDTTKH